jgi:hypothetical protein
VNFDMGRFGIEFVASPRHADGIVLSGTTTRNMEHALAATYEAVRAQTSDPFRCVRDQRRDISRFESTSAGVFGKAKNRSLHPRLPAASTDVYLRAAYLSEQDARHF